MRDKLLGKDLRSISKANQVVNMVKLQKDFDELFIFLYDDNRLLRIRSIDAIEKITLTYPEFLSSHQSEIFDLCNTDHDKEFKWHLALLLARLKLDLDALTIAFITLNKWALDSNESKIVRVNAIQSLYDLTSQNKQYNDDFQVIIRTVKKENIPSLNARIKKFNIAD